MQTYKLTCRANQSFRWTRDISAYLAIFDLPNCVIRLQMRQGPFLAVEYEWSTANSKAVYSAGSVVFSAPVKDLLNFKGTYYGDLRIETAAGVPVVIAQVTFVWAQGFTRTTADETEADTSITNDTVETDGEAALTPSIGYMLAAGDINNIAYTARTAANGGNGDLILSLSKEAIGDTASLLLKTGGSGRAELGLLSDDNLLFKVSPNGSRWRSAVRFNKSSGRLTFPGRYWRNMPPNIVQRNHVTSNNWIISTSAADNSWFSVCWSPELGLFCAVANSGVGNRVMTSPDGVTWTTRTSAADNDWRSVCWSSELGLFCAVGGSGTGNRVMTSPDGVTWTTRSSAADNGWLAVCWSPELGLFCAVANGGAGTRVMTSKSAYSYSYR
jgi:hypothetical protein